jgi:transcription elongation factor Elf1
LSEIKKCPGCGSEFDSKEKLIDHVVEKHESNCQICGAELETKEELLKHNLEKHGV